MRGDSELAWCYRDLSQEPRDGALRCDTASPKGAFWWQTIVQRPDSGSWVQDTATSRPPQQVTAGSPPLVILLCHTRTSGAEFPCRCGAHIQAGSLRGSLAAALLVDGKVNLCIWIPSAWFFFLSSHNCIIKVPN